jgi:NADH-quinone oxidoreductase subunit L
VGAFAAGIFHLMTHAFFKALLFLGAGSVMHALGGQTDLRKMGGLQYKLPVTFWTFVIAALAISGMPGFAGFFSKDEILLKAFTSDRGSPILWLLALITAGMTVLYIWRVIALTFLGDSRMSHHSEEHAHESPPVMYWPLVILALLAIVGGYVGVPAILGGGNQFEHFLAPVFGETAASHVEAGTEWGLMITAVIVALAALFAIYYAYILKPELPGKVAKAFGPAYRIAYNKYYIDELYVAVIVNPLKALADWLARVFDVRVIDGIVNSIGAAVIWCGQRLRSLQSGYVRSYALAILCGVVVLLAYAVLR